MTNLLSALRRLLGEYSRYLTCRTDLKPKANSIRGRAKQVISYLRHNKVSQAQQILRSLDKEIRSLKKTFQKYPPLASEGFWREAIEEYCEAKIYYSFLYTKPLSLAVETSYYLEEILGGYCDFTGELIRKVISSKDSFAVLRQLDYFIKTVSALVNTFATLAFSGRLRAKYDQLERNLKQLEKIRYEIRLYTTSFREKK